VDEADSISAEISDNGHDDDVKPEKRLTRYSYSNSKSILFEVFLCIRPCNSPQYLGVLHILQRTECTVIVMVRKTEEHFSGSCLP
jgi:hypothetical protein